MLIQIKQEHIDKAIRNYDDFSKMVSERCVVALAIQEALGQERIICGFTDVSRREESGEYTYLGKLVGAEEIVQAFDNKQFDAIKPKTIVFNPVGVEEPGE